MIDRDRALIERATLTEEDLDRLEALAKAATPGTWKRGALASYNAVTGEPVRFVYRGDNESVETRLRVCGGEGENGQVFDCDADAAFIAAANPQTVLALLSAARDEGRAEGLGGEWVMVPREPTREMLKAAGDYADECARLNYGGAPDAEGVWDAMITAAPPASQTQEG